MIGVTISVDSALLSFVAVLPPIGTSISTTNVVDEEVAPAVGCCDDVIVDVIVVVVSFGSDADADADDVESIMFSVSAVAVAIVGASHDVTR